MVSARRAVAAGRRESLGGRVTFTEAARHAAVERVAAELAAGGSVAQAARNLGIEYVTLRRWPTARASGPLLRPVQVAEESPRQRLVVVLPKGARIEGLDLSGLLEVVERLA